MAILGRRQPFHQKRLSSLVFGPVVTYSLACAAGAYAISGADAGLQAGRKAAAAAGSYAISGANAGLKTGRKVGAGVGAYVIDGAAARLRTSNDPTGAGSRRILLLGVG